MKIGKQLRNLLLRQPETFAVNETTAWYFNEKYTYPKTTDMEILDKIKETQDLLYGKTTTH